jgi:hypothetical protein
LFANNGLTALTADDTDNAKKSNTNTTTKTANDTDNAKKSNTNTTTKKFKKSTTTTTKEPNPTSIIRKFAPPRLDVSFYCFHLIIFIKLLFNIFIIFLYQPALASSTSSSSPSTGASSTISSRQQQSKKTAEGAFIV